MNVRSFYLAALILVGGCDTSGFQHLYFFPDYHEGLAAAKRKGKPVFMYSTGFAVGFDTFQRKIARSERVTDYLNENFVTTILYVDDPRNAHPLEIAQMENFPGFTGKETTKGDLNYLAHFHHFRTPNHPYAIFLDHTGKILGSEEKFTFHKVSPDEFLEKLHETKLRYERLQFD